MTKSPLYTTILAIAIAVGSAAMATGALAADHGGGGHMGGGGGLHLAAKTTDPTPLRVRAPPPQSN